MLLEFFFDYFLLFGMTNTCFSKENNIADKII